MDLPEHICKIQSSQTFKTRVRVMNQEMFYSAVKTSSSFGCSI